MTGNVRVGIAAVSNPLAVLGAGRLVTDVEVARGAARPSSGAGSARPAVGTGRPAWAARSCRRATGTVSARRPAVDRGRGAAPSRLELLLVATGPLPTSPPPWRSSPDLPALLAGLRADPVEPRALRRQSSSETDMRIEPGRGARPWSSRLLAGDPLPHYVGLDVTERSRITPGLDDLDARARLRTRPSPASSPTPPLLRSSDYERRAAPTAPACTTRSPWRRVGRAASRSSPRRGWVECDGAGRAA